MRTLSNREKIIVRIAAVGVPAYLFIFFAMGGTKHTGGGRAEYERLLNEAGALRQELMPYEQRGKTVAALMEEFHMDPAKLKKSSVVGEASAAIQKTAASSGVGLGPIRESPGRASAKELASIKLEGTGQLPAVMGFLKRLETLGYPLLIDSVQISPDSKGPGNIKLTLTIMILDFEQWKGEGVPHV